MSKDSDFRHIPVLSKQAVACLALRPDGFYVDCTVGGGGHSELILRSLDENGTLLAIDQDEEALAAARKRLDGCGKARQLWQKDNFSSLPRILRDLEVPAVDGILADLGVSSWQLDETSRGFSYQRDAQLDMRMDQAQTLTAAVIVNEWPQKKLEHILRTYGEERHAARISKAIVSRRQEKPLTRTVQLADLVRSVMPASSRREKQHPARRTFQAIRIAVNDELASLDTLLEAAPQVLGDGGRIAIISFHSLEDRRIKNAFRDWENPCTCPRDFPVCTCGKKPLGRRIHRQGLKAEPWELKHNPRAGSARLRCFERSLQKEQES